MGENNIQQRSFGRGGSHDAAFHDFDFDKEYNGLDTAYGDLPEWDLDDDDPLAGFDFDTARHKPHREASISGFGSSFLLQSAASLLDLDLNALDDSSVLHQDRQPGPPSKVRSTVYFPSSLFEEEEISPSSLCSAGAVHRRVHFSEHSHIQDSSSNKEDLQITIYEVPDYSDFKKCDVFYSTQELLQFRQEMMKEVIMGVWDEYMKEMEQNTLVYQQEHPKQQ